MAESSNPTLPVLILFLVCLSRYIRSSLSIVCRILLEFFCSLLDRQCSNDSLEGTLKFNPTSHLNMNSTIIFCNVCFNSWMNNKSIHFFLTSCGKIVCKNCLPRQPTCSKCGPNCSRKIINNQMGQDVEIFFVDTTAQKKRIMNAELFQQNRYKQLVKYLYQKIAYLKGQLQEKNGRIQILEEQKCALDISVRKLKESNHYMQQKTHHSNYQKSSSNKQFEANFLGAINEQIVANESAIMSNSNGIYHRGNMSTSNQLQSRGYYYPSSRPGSVVGRAKSQRKSNLPISLDPVVHNPRIYQSTPLVSAGHQGHNQIAASYKGYRYNGRNQAKSAISNYSRRSRKSTSKYFK